ncbi:Leucine-rich repeat-containing protein 72 [Phytophthora pseudosyringae]|uniref:Leucine-rich repeat-containing protein 72 n=1 Tax=Phytophthora pseudosyringae TaxID=221518 RepID=A0A8T1W6P3_9STRA|nr:Leucine-rich repeat-containing protein 72 [Phytophthora pseudosyringae]
MSKSSTTRKLRLSDPHAELPIKNHKYVKNCTELYMTNKRIDKLANFDAFVNLEVLWINDNQIQQLDGLDECFRLKQLYAQNNCICSLGGSSLPHFQFLQELRLYDNKLKDLQGTLEVLRRLSHLRDLDLFGNAIVEEENYRLQVIRAIPSLAVLDRHVITDAERAKAARLQLHFGEDGGVHGGISNQHGTKKGKKQSGTVAGAPSQVLSGTVKILFKEVAAIKREQEKQDHEASERQQELKITQGQELSTNSRSRCSANNNKADEIPGLGDWEVTALKKHFQSLEEVKNGGIGQENLEGVIRYLRTRGYAVSYNGFRLEGKRGGLQHLESILPAPGTIQWKPFVQFFESKQLQCEMLSPPDLRQQAAACFDKCAVMQRRLQALQHSDARSAQLVKESLELSQQGYHLQALADDNPSSGRSTSSRVPSSADIGENWEVASTSTPRTRFYMTAFSREKTSAPPSVSASRECSSKFSELKSESEHVSEALAGKYKIRHKDFTKYLTKQSLQTTKLVRRNYQL